MKVLFASAISLLPIASPAGAAGVSDEGDVIIARQIAGTRDVIYKDSIREVAKGIFHIESGNEVGSFTLTSESLINCINMTEVGLMETPDSKVSDQIAHYLKDRKGGTSDSVMIRALCTHFGYSR